MQKWNERNQLDMTSQTLREARKYEEAAEKMIKEEKSAEPKMKECPYCCSEIPIKAKRCPHCTSEL